MKIGKLDTEKEIIVIAEIGNNHEGDFTLAKELIKLASKAGADCVKFQTIVPEKLVMTYEKERISQLSRYCFKYNQFKVLKQVADSNGVLFLSTPFDLESAIFLNDLVPAFKVASGDIDFFPLLKTVALTGKPIILSTGASYMEEIINAKSYIETIWKSNGIVQELAILHCVSSYPAPLEDANLLAIPLMKEKLGATIGYSDHTTSIEAAVISAALGARIIEKHFTINKNHSSFHDHIISAEPSEMLELVRRVKDIPKLLGHGRKEPAPSEVVSRQKARRSITAATNLKKGSSLSISDLNWLRPASGISPNMTDKITGHKLLRDIFSANPILEGDIEK